MTENDERKGAWWSRPDDDPWRPPQPAARTAEQPAGSAAGDEARVDEAGARAVAADQASEQTAEQPAVPGPQAAPRTDQPAPGTDQGQGYGHDRGEASGYSQPVWYRQPAGQQQWQQQWQQGAEEPPGPAFGWPSPGGGQMDTLGGIRGASRAVQVPLVLLIVGAVAVALLAGLVGGGIGAFVQERRGSGSATDPDASLGSAPAGEVERPPDSVAGLAARILPSVVSIQVKGGGRRGTGSGAVIRSDGYILTNNHVVEAASSSGEIEVQFADNQRAAAKIVGRDASYDLAVIKTVRPGLRALPMGNSDAVQIGDPVIAIGSPLGLSGTVTTGIISAKERAVTAGGGGEESFIQALQTDAAINPGNSGGPLVNLAGQMVGVNSAIATLDSGGPLGGGQGGNIGLGFSIPINQARRTAEQLIRTGKAVHPIIGVTLDRQFEGEGVRILPQPLNGSVPVQPGGPAEKAGLKAGDVITKLEGKPVESPNELIVAIRAKVPGDQVQITFLRGGKEQTVTMTLAAAPSN
jgi:putative serine protease PepD